MAVDNLCVKCVPYRAVCTEFLSRALSEPVDRYFSVGLQALGEVLYSSWF